MEPRKIMIYNQTGNQETEIHSSAMTWGELTPELTRRNVQFDGLDVIIGENETRLTSSTSALLDTEMSIFLLPSKVNSGN